MTRRDLLPASALPLAYFAFAHAGLATAFLMLAVRPDLAGGYFLHPRMVALVHLVTLAWISGSILGAFYIVAPLALGASSPAMTIARRLSALFDGPRENSRTTSDRSPGGIAVIR